MFLELDPGHRARRASTRRATRSPSPTRRPDTNLDEVLAALDTDTRAYLRLLLVGGGEGLRGRGKDLGELLGSLGPVNRDLARLNREVAKRRDNLATLIHNMNLLFGRVGQEAEEIAALSTPPTPSLGAIASAGPRRAPRDRRSSARRCARPGSPSRRRASWPRCSGRR